ncbi:MAG TPA: zf-TFIIB domain-containing protein [Gaiellaceae bacterium]|nr:zf-TFIIB domain-containing protein [Gaiellaceae bacterium]
MERVCPEDGTVLRHIERSGVSVDACPTCRGVWLDRGELDKIVERERANLDDFEREIAGEARRRDDRGHEGGGHGGYGKPYKKKKRHSILEDLLDFG